MNNNPTNDRSVSVEQGIADQNKRKNDPRVRKKLILTAIALLLAAVLVGVNLLITLLPWSARAGLLTTDPIYGITSVTKNALTQLSEDVDIYLICENGELGANQNMLSFLKNYEAHSKHVSVEILDNVTDAALLADMGIGDLSQTGDSYVLVRSNRRQRLLPVSGMEYYECPDLEMTFSVTEYAQYRAELAEMEVAVYRYFRGEEKVTNALDFVCREDVPVVAIASAVYRDDDGQAYPLYDELGSDLLERILDSGYEVRYILSPSQLTDEHELLILNAPRVLTSGDASALSSWLANGGRMFLTTLFDFNPLDRLNTVLAEYGLSADGAYTCLGEGSSHNQIKDGVATAAMYEINSSLGMAGGAKKDVLLAISDFHAVYWEERDGVEVTPWLHTTSSGYRQTYNPSTGKWNKYSDSKGTYHFGMKAQTDTTRIAWIASPDVLTDNMNDLSYNGNYDLVLSALDWMAEDRGVAFSTDIKATSLDVAPFQVTFTSFYFWGAMLIVIIPAAILTVGGIRVYVRKKR